MTSRRRAFTITAAGVGATVALPDHDALSVLQATVGGHIEHVLTDRRDVTMYANEAGKLEGLPRNEVATALMDCRHALWDYVAGDVLVCGSPDRDGEDTGLTDEQLGWLEAAVRRWAG